MGTNTCLLLVQVAIRELFAFQALNSLYSFSFGPLLLEVAKRVTCYCEAQSSSPWLSYNQANRSVDKRDP